MNKIFCLYIGLFSGYIFIITAIANDTMPDEDRQGISKDRKFIEANCSHPGIQEINIYKHGDYKLTSYNLETKKKTLELSGKWELSDNILILHHNDSMIKFMMDSKIQNLLDKEFLLASLIPVYDDTHLPFADCRYHDHRMVESLIHFE